MHRLVGEWVHRQPSACAVRESDSGRELTYLELWEHAGRLAGALAARGVGRGDRVAVALDPSVDLVVAFLGIIRAGAAYLPLDRHAPGDRLAGIVEDADVSLVVCAATLDERRWRLPPRLARIDVRDQRSVSAPEVETGADDPIYVAFTSGSTGRPKGVVVPHRAVIRLAVNPNYCTIAPGDRVANLANPAFDATTFEVWNTLVAGGTVVTIPSATDLPIDDWIGVLARESITTMFLTTSLFHTVARERPDAFATLDTLIVGGEQLDLGAARDVLAARPPRRLVNAYGPTETTTFAATFECTAENLAGATRVPIGFALQNTSTHVLDDDLTPVAAGEMGELCIGGPGVALGYLGRPDLTAAKFVTDPRSGELIYRTGDMARVLPSGALEVAGRRDRQVKLRGFRIELDEIEEALRDTGLVDAAFVEKVGEGPTAALVAFVLPARFAAPDMATLPVLLARRLPKYMIPARWLRLTGVPLGPTGKADRARLLELLARADQPDDGAERADDVRAALAGIWRDVLGVAEVSPADSFLDLGGNSILAIQVASRAGQALRVRVEPGDVLLADTFGELNTVLRQKMSAGVGS
ncbi:non-ribosomal peptide synthetase [Actinophytocola sp.]|uniref:non-ribosomal peptide synthetase n=1 Tax=Actinophytocola sp. TaxID=1872138 RepID=UPI002ED109EA